MGPETKNNRTGEGQQEITRAKPISHELTVSRGLEWALTVSCEHGSTGIYTVRSCYQVMISRDLTDWEDLVCFFISGVGLSPLGTAATSGLLYQPQMIDDGDCGASGEMKIGRGNRSTRRKPAPAPLCPPQIPHDQTRALTQAAAVGSQWLTTWAMARPSVLVEVL
jgi:hypothetical protein